MFTIDPNYIICLAAAWLIEIVLGSPKFLPRPSKLATHCAIAAADRVLSVSERAANRKNGGNGRAAKLDRHAGIFLAVYVLMFTFIVTAVLLDLSHRLHPALYYILTSLIISEAINTRKAADAAISSRKANDAAIVKRKTPTDYANGSGDPHINEKRIIWDLSKNCLDGVYAPLLYVTIGIFLGVPAALTATYRMLAALDGAVGHKEGEYKNIGWAAAKLDDAANFLPARICGAVLPLHAALCGSGARGMLRGFRATRDAHSARSYGHNYKSVNDIWAAAAFAGVLGVSLGGAETRPAGGNAAEGLAEPGDNETGKAIRLMIAASLSAVILICCALAYYAAAAN